MVGLGLGDVGGASCSTRDSICDNDLAGDDLAELDLWLEWKVELLVTDAIFEPKENLRVLSPRVEEMEAAAPDRSICCQASRRGLKVELINSFDCSRVRARLAGEPPVEKRCTGAGRGMDRGGVTTSEKWLFETSGVGLAVRSSSCCSLPSSLSEGASEVTGVSARAAR